MPRFAPAPLDATIDPMDLPNDQAIRWVVRRYASLLARDSRPASARKLVQPTGEFFPDSFDGDPGSINLLFWRLQEHSGLTDLECELRFVDDRDSGGHECKCGKGGCKDGGCGDGKEGGCSCGSGGGCGSGGCGTGHKHGEPSLAEVKRLADGAWRVDVRLSDAKSATTLTAALATSLAHVFVVETGGFESWPEAEWMGTCEVAATLLGFGVLIANASYLYAKACKGVSIDKATALEVGDIAVGLALFTMLNQIPAWRASANLETTQRSAYAEARSWAESNSKLMRRLERDPGAVAADELVSVEPARSWLARILGLGAKKSKVPDLSDEEAIAQVAASVAASRKDKPRKQDARDLELRALVEESLHEAQSEAERE